MNVSAAHYFTGTFAALAVAVKKRDWVKTSGSTKYCMGQFLLCAACQQSNIVGATAKKLKLSAK
jgi:hypothetical protein